MPRGDLHPAYFEARFRTEEPVCDWPRDFLIITAFATTGETWTVEQNSSADRALEQAIRERALWYRRVEGYSTSTGHAEPGWAVEMPLEEGCRLGCRFLQDAIYRVKDGGLFVVPCGSPDAVEVVGLFAERLDP